MPAKKTPAFLLLYFGQNSSIYRLQIYAKDNVALHIFILF